MNSFSIIKVTDPRWVEIISLSKQYDFYHTQSYSMLEKTYEPVLCVAFQDSDFIAIPLLLRGIEKTDLFDCTSVYGYCGPVSNLHFENLSKDHISYFQSELFSFFKKSHIVSAFSRLHPIYNQDPVFQNFGMIRDINKTVAIDLTLPKEEQFGKYRKVHKQLIKKLRENGFVVITASTKYEIDYFIQIYHKLMKRLSADSSYFFEKEYFYQMLDNPCFESKLLLAKRDNEIAGGAIFTLVNGIMQYHLSAETLKFRDQSPTRLIIDEARLLGCEHNMKFLHLGGGVHGNSEDSLFKFKKGFSDLLFDFRGWQLIVDQSKYSYLIDFFGIDTQNTTDYFPVYRAN